MKLNKKQERWIKELEELWNFFEARLTRARKQQVLLGYLPTFHGITLILNSLLFLSERVKKPCIALIPALSEAAA